MTDNNHQSEQKVLLTGNDGKLVFIKAEHKYHGPESFRKCTIEVLGRADGVGTGSHFCLIEPKGGQGKYKNLPCDEIRTNQLRI